MKEKREIERKWEKNSFKNRKEESNCLIEREKIERFFLKKSKIERIQTVGPALDQLAEKWGISTLVKNLGKIQSQLNSDLDK